MIAVVAVAVLALSVVKTVGIMRRGPSTAAAEQVASMCVEFMKANGDRWPRNWDDLRDQQKAWSRRSPDSPDLAELERRVAVDWNADPFHVDVEDDSSVGDQRLE